MIVVAGAEFLLQVQRRLLRARCHGGIQNPRGEPRLQHLGCKPRCHVHTGDLLQGCLELGSVHVAVVQLGQHRLHPRSEQFIAEVGPQVVRNRGAFVVGVASVDFLIGHGRKRVESVVLDVAFFQHKQLVVFDHINEGFLTVFPLHKQVRAVLRRPFLQPHVVVNARRNDVTPPMVSEFMAEQVTVGHQPFTHHELWVSDVGGNLKGAVGGQHIPDALPSVRPPPVFQGVDGESQFLEFGDHGPDVFGLAGEAYGHIPIRSGMHVI